MWMNVNFTVISLMSQSPPSGSSTAVPLEDCPASPTSEAVAAETGLRLGGWWELLAVSLDDTFISDRWSGRSDWPWPGLSLRTRYGKWWIAAKNASSSSTLITTWYGFNHRVWLMNPPQSKKQIREADVPYVNRLKNKQPYPPPTPPPPPLASILLKANGFNHTWISSIKVQLEIGHHDIKDNVFFKRGVCWGGVANFLNHVDPPIEGLMESSSWK